MTSAKNYAASRDADKFVVRLPDGMRERIAEVAQASRRSMNSVIISRLEASLTPAGQHEIVPGEVKTLAPQEKSLLARFRSLDPDHQMALIEFMKHSSSGSETKSPTPAGPP